MTSDILTLLGGIGLFLFGMQTLTEALKQSTGQKSRALLARFTRTPLAGVATGAIATSVVQSSSATTVMTIGFVGAGLITFPQALGVLYGAHIGTTMTGWVVVVIGFKLKLGQIALPVLFLASLIAVLGRGTAARSGRILAGLALVFIGLDFMQQGMAEFEDALSPADFPSEHGMGRFWLVLIGIAITLVTQSSSAGVATALVLLGAGTVSFGQAATMVVGMHVGTTVTALLASAGGTAAMRQTAVANIIYMIGTGALALLILPFVGPLLRDGLFRGDAMLALIGFHTTFNLIGTAVFLPFTHRFARAVERLVPGPGGNAADVLHPQLLSDPAAALDAAAGFAAEVARNLFAALAASLGPQPSFARLPAAREEAEAALLALHAFVTRIEVPQGQEALLLRYAALLHQIDHLQRLTHRAWQENRIQTATRLPYLTRYARVLAALMLRSAEPGTDARLLRLEARLSRREERLRSRALAPEQVLNRPLAEVFAATDAIRWLRRCTTHSERILHHGAAALPVAARPPAPAAPPGRSGGA
ncbi:Na/Pi cotransporter family protein [Plastorhodobacter daqingensis]|uniref:Na/Pi cotransporter family protein n=1 Tax=Plastorhodobacter daqingensis TaxID=1387281 RepID=A0ABW2UHN5_9RHOB